MENLFRRRYTRQVSTHTLDNFNELRLNVKLCDASLILENGDVYPIHRSVLSGSSDYFRLVTIIPIHLFDNYRFYFAFISHEEIVTIEIQY